MPVPTLTGAVSLSIPAGSNTGGTLRLKGKGVLASTPGDLLRDVLVVTLPDKPDLTRSRPSRKVGRPATTRGAKLK